MEINNNNNNIETNNNETDVKPVKAKQCMIKYFKRKAVKRAKAKQYQKKKQNEEYMQDMRKRALDWLYKHKGPSPNPVHEIEYYLPKITA